MKKVYALQTKLIDSKTNDYMLMDIYEKKEDAVKRLEKEGLTFYSHVDNDGINEEADYYIDKIIVAQIKPMELK